MPKYFGEKEINRRLRISKTLREKKIKPPQNFGADHANWKGEDASYQAKHIWMRKNFGSPNNCEHCFKTDKKAYQWANISKMYKRERSDWLRLCVPCHAVYDGRNKLNDKQVRIMRWAHHYGASKNYLSKFFGISKSVVDRILKNKNRGIIIN